MLPQSVPSLSNVATPFSHWHELWRPLLCHSAHEVEIAVFESPSFHDGSGSLDAVVPGCATVVDEEDGSAVPVSGTPPHAHPRAVTSPTE